VLDPRYGVEDWAGLWRVRKVGKVGTEWHFRGFSSYGFKVVWLCVHGVIV